MLLVSVSWTYHLLLNASDTNCEEKWQFIIGPPFKTKKITALSYLRITETTI